MLIVHVTCCCDLYYYTNKFFYFIENSIIISESKSSQIYDSVVSPGILFSIVKELFSFLVVWVSVNYQKWMKYFYFIDTVLQG